MEPSPDTIAQPICYVGLGASAGGLEALDWFRDHADAVDVVLSDVVMPGLSGPKLVERLRGIRDDLAYLFMSGYPRDEVTSPLLADAGTAFLHKPFDSVTLLSTVRKVLDARKRARGRAG